MGSAGRGRSRSRTLEALVLPAEFPVGAAHVEDVVEGVERFVDEPSFRLVALFLLLTLGDVLGEAGDE